MKISYTKQFINTIDSLLESEYNKITKREDFLALLAKIEVLMGSHENGEDGEKAWFENNKLRTIFGKVTLPTLGESNLSPFEGSEFKSINKESNISKIINKDNNKDLYPITRGTSSTIEPCYDENKISNLKKRVWKLDLLLKILEDKNIIIKTPYDKNNGKTRYYFYSSIFQYLCEEAEIEVIKEEISDRYINLFLKSLKPPKELHLKVQYDLLMSDRFQIDVNSALMWIDDQYYNKKNISLNQKRTYTRMVLYLDDKRIFVTEGAKGGRVFTNFNTIKRELREFCTIDGQRLMSLDLKSSQPYLMAQYMAKHYPIESKSFYDAVTKEDIYLFFLKKWNGSNPCGYYREFNIVKNCMVEVHLNSRDDIKPEYLKIMFKTSGRKPILEDLFKQEFPFVYSKVQEEKENLAAKLQREESEIFIPVCTQFAKEGCLSVHDSLYFKPELYSSILNSLKEVFEDKSFKNYTLK